MGNAEALLTPVLTVTAMAGEAGALTFSGMLRPFGSLFNPTSSSRRSVYIWSHFS